MGPDMIKVMSPMTIKRQISRQLSKDSSCCVYHLSCVVFVCFFLFFSVCVCVHVCVLSVSCDSGFGGRNI